MITAWSKGAAAAGTLRPPGLYVHHASALPPASRPAARSGVPAFLGFGRWIDPSAWGRRHARARVDCNSLAAFDGAVKADPRGFLRDAVAGFFHNGGQRCVVMLAASAEDNESARVAAMHRLLQRDGALEECSQTDLVCLPDAVCRELISDSDAQWLLQSALLDHCQRTGERFAILDAPWSAGEQSLQRTLSARERLPSQFGAMYFPWILPTPWHATPNGPRFDFDAQWRCLAVDSAGHRMRTGERGHAVPPCGHVAGLYARLDAESGGPHRAPANATLQGVVDVSQGLSPAQQGQLSNGQVNCLEHINGHGVSVGGARTLSGNGGCPYVSMARVLIDFRRWLAVGLRDIVFESLTAELWDTVRLRLWIHCSDLWQAGGLAGVQEAEAFEVKCDSETNPPSAREQGQVVAHVRLAPSVPAEFIDVRVVHDANGFTTSGP